MPGDPTKIFELELAPLLPAARQGIAWEELAPGLKELLEAVRWQGLFGKVVVPLGLRWRLTPGLGLPRTPFAVFRRDRRRGDPVDVRFTSAEVASLGIGGGRFHIAARELYVLIVAVRNMEPGRSVTVQALDAASRPLPFQTVEVPPNTLRFVRFQHPFIGGFRCTGANFEIASVEAVSMRGLAERPGEWELIERAGLPAERNEIEGYDTGQQGDPDAPVEPPDAALARVAVGQQFYRDLATTLPNGVTVPQWEIPEPNEALGELRSPTPDAAGRSLILRLGEMFRAVDTGAVPNQAAFRSLETMPGLRQPGSPQVTPDATMDMPLLATVLLNAVTDPWFSLVCGFGTADFPEFLEPSERFLEPEGYFDISHDYMVRAEFRFRLFGVEFKREHFALSHRSPFPTLQPAQLQAALHAVNRPPRRDDPWSAEVAVTWARNRHAQLQGNAVALSTDGSAGAYLNPPRPGNPEDNPALFVPMNPGTGGDPILATRNRFIHHGAELPFTGVRTTRYGVATMDVFGRWSDWSTADLTLAPRPPDVPRLIGLSLAPDKSRISGNTCPHTLSFEILWDWQDRSPARFQLAGVFHARRTLPDGTRDNGHVPPPAYPGVFQTDNAAPTGTLLEITLPSDSPPGTPPELGATPTTTTPAVTIELLPQATDAGGQNVEGEMRRYRVTVADLNVAFGPDEEWFYSLYVKAAEWRNPALLSDENPPLPPGRPPRLTAYVPNPIPAPPPVFVPATVLWAALPDAAEVSRFRLAFDRVPTATGGYGVYLAYEAKLRDLAGLPVRDDGDLVGRATDLRDLAMPLARCLDGFSRLNARLVPQPPVGNQVVYEVELPGALDGLVALAVASVTAEQETSPLSTPWLFVAVPRRVSPQMPHLSLASSNGSALLTCEVARAPAPARLELLRARAERPARTVDTMGPPMHVSVPADWQALDASGRPAAAEAGTARFRLVHADPTPPSWFPYYYRAVAIGAGDATLGLVPGRSPQSNLVRVELLPRTLPVIDGLATEQTGAQTVMVRFRSDAVVDVTPHGSFRLAVSAFDFDERQFGDPLLTGFLPAAQPRPAAGALEGGVLYYSEPDADGLRTFEAPVDVPGERFLLRVRLTDPLDRSSERTVGGVLEELANEAPDLSELRLRKRLRDLLVRFASSTSTAQPPSGEYRVEIHFRRAVGPPLQRLLLTTALHSIAAGTQNELQTAPDTTILRLSDGTASQPAQYGAVIKNIFPQGPLPPPLRGIVRVRMTAPDGTRVQLEEQLG
jgi:hypothetical protein